MLVLKYSTANEIIAPYLLKLPVDHLAYSIKHIHLSFSDHGHHVSNSQHSHHCSTHSNMTLYLADLFTDLNYVAWASPFTFRSGLAHLGPACPADFLAQLIFLLATLTLKYKYSKFGQIMCAHTEKNVVMANGLVISRNTSQKPSVNMPNSTVYHELRMTKI